MHAAPVPVPKPVRHGKGLPAAVHVASGATSVQLHWQSMVAAVSATSDGPLLSAFTGEPPAKSGEQVVSHASLVVTAPTFTALAKYALFVVEAIVLVRSQSASVGFVTLTKPVVSGPEAVIVAEAAGCVTAVATVPAVEESLLVLGAESLAGDAAYETSVGRDVITGDNYVRVLISGAPLHAASRKSHARECCESVAGR